MLARLLNKPIKPHDRVVHFILINACYQLEQMRTPQYATVSQSVDAVAGGRFAWAGALINAVLRAFVSGRKGLRQGLEPDAQVAFPRWLYRLIEAHWPEHSRQVFDASNRKPPLTLRVNVRQISRAAYLERLAHAGIAAWPTTDSPLGVTFETPLPVERIPGFADGLVSVQDEAAQLTLLALIGVSGATGATGIPATSDTTDTPDTSGTPDAPDATDTTGATAITGAPDTADTPVTPDIVATPATTDSLGATGLPATPDTIDTLGTTDTPATPDTDTPTPAKLPAGERVLDACAAPGGKTCLLLEADPPPATLVAMDLPARVEALRQNLKRLGFDFDSEVIAADVTDPVIDARVKVIATDVTDSSPDSRVKAITADVTDSKTNPGANPKVKVIAADVTDPESWWDGRLFDRILLDVPCSGSGIIRRHPDIKHRRQPQDIAQFARQQLHLLSQAWRLLGNGGTLLYVTCSILPTENDAVIEQFMQQQNVQPESEPRPQPQPLDARLGIATRFGRQRLPGVHPGDGFYYCRLRKVAAVSPQSQTALAAHPSSQPSQP